MKLPDKDKENRKISEQKIQTNVRLKLAFLPLLWYNISQYKDNDRGEDLMDKAISIDKHDRNQHSVYLLYYHLILVVKYRRKVFDDSISERAKEIFCYIAKGYDITLEEWNHDEDHVHVMFRAKPATQISKFINAYKSASSRLLKKEFPQIRSRLWKEYFWSRSFCLLTAGGAPVEVIREYIESQGKGGRNGKKL